MADYNDDLDNLNDLDDTDEEVQQEQKRKPNWRRELEARARAADEARREADAAKRELALIRAGVDLDSPQGKLFAKAYDGDPTVEAIRKSAEEYGMLQPPAPAVDPAELAAHNRVSQASAGSPAAPPADPLADLNAIPLMKNGDYNPDALTELNAWLNKYGGRFSHDSPGGLLREDASQPLG